MHKADRGDELTCGLDIDSTVSASLTRLPNSLCRLLLLAQW